MRSSRKRATLLLRRGWRVRRRSGDGDLYATFALVTFRYAMMRAPRKRFSLLWLALSPFRAFAHERTTLAGQRRLGEADPAWYTHTTIAQEAFDKAVLARATDFTILRPVGRRDDGVQSSFKSQLPSLLWLFPPIPPSGIIAGAALWRGGETALRTEALAGTVANHPDTTIKPAAWRISVNERR